MSKATTPSASKGKDILSYLVSAQAYWGRYHDHKETSAWASLVLFIVFASSVPNFLTSMGVNTLLERIIASCFILVVWFVIHRHVAKQFSLLARAGALTHAYLFLEAMYLSGTHFTLEEFRPIVVSDPATESEWSTPVVVEQAIKNHMRQGARPRIAIEQIIHLLTVIVGAFLLIMIWVV